MLQVRPFRYPGLGTVAVESCVIFGEGGGEKRRVNKLCTLCQSGNASGDRICRT